MNAASLATSVAAKPPGTNSRSQRSISAMRRRAGEDETAVGLDLAAGLGGDDDARAGDAPEDRVRRGEIELRHAGIDRFDDEEFGFGHGALLRFDGVTIAE